MQLNDFSTASANRVCSTSAGRAASVKTKASMVARSGAIMPDPLAMPLRVTSMPPMLAVRVAPLGKVSVVIIALAAACHAPGAKSAFSPGNAPMILSNASGSPMTPVEAAKIFDGRQEN